MVALSEYEMCALDEVGEYRRRQLERSPKKIVPEKLRDAAARRSKTAQARARAVPGADQLFQRTAVAYAKAADGIGKAASAAGYVTLSEARVRRAYTRHGHPVAELAAVRDLDLQVVDRVRPRRMDALYAAIAGLEGAAAGAVISGGEAAAMFGTVLGAGAGAVPGVGTIAATMAGDAAFVLGAGSRAVAHTAMYYGYDPGGPGEALFMMGVLNLGTATTAGAKYAAYREMSQLAQALARRATWAQLEQHLLTKVAQKFASDMGTRLTQKKLGQLVPAAGFAVAAGLNYRTIDAICDAAYWAYRERFLHEKRGDGWVVPPPPRPDVDVDGEGAEVPRDSNVSVLEAIGSERSTAATA